MTTDRRPATEPADDPRPIDVTIHGEMLEWLAASEGSIVVTTYNAGKLAVFSAPTGRLQTRIWKFPRPMGVALDAGKIALAYRRRLAVFEVDGKQGAPGEDVVYRLRDCFDTGRLDVHDVAFAGEKIYFANTRYNCLARPSQRVNFLRSWQPPFCRQMIARDCCHLNGVGVRNQRPAMVTAFAETDQTGGWRSLDRFQSGIVIDVRQRAVVVRDLNMPHSPRWHDGRWWLCNSGAGVLATFDPVAGNVTEIAALPGFTRGLCFAAGHALVGTSRIRPQHILDAPPLRTPGAAARAGVSLVDCRSGREVGALEFVRGGSEVYEVAFVPEVVHAALHYPPEIAQLSDE